MNRSLLSQRYVPLRKLASGGMGEIFLARQTGVAGFQRQVVLKRIHRRLGDNPRAVRMFLDEARLAAGLSHPNIVQIYDVGEEEGAYFIVMERITGTNLRELAETTSRQGQMIPMELSLTIICQVLEGLRYAHGFRDETGRPLRIVHRDICPTNILVSYDGAVKIVDFGIARAETQMRQDTGVAPGKFAYMAPEMITSEPVDARSDLFSVGVLLYELTVGQRLFRAASYEAMLRVVNDPIPPPTFARAGYPVDLEIIVMRALERNPAERYDSAESMLEDLERFAFGTAMRLSRLRLGRFVSKVMGVSSASLLEPGLQGDAPEEVADETVQEDLDFDRDGLFGEEEPPVEEEPPTEVTAPASPVMEAMRQANEAIAELVSAEAGDDDEEGHTVEMRPSSQAHLRAQTVPPEEPREGSALIVTDDLVEEVTDIEDSEQVLLSPDAHWLEEDDVEEEEEEEPIRPREPSTDLRRALADISQELEAAAAVDRQREESLEALAGGSRDDRPERLVGALLGRGQPASKVAAPRPVPTGELVDDELESVDHGGRRPPDDLELSDTTRRVTVPEPEEEDSLLLEVDDEGLDDGTIELDGEDAPEVVEVRPLPVPPPAPPAWDGLDDPTIKDVPLMAKAEAPAPAPTGSRSSRPSAARDPGPRALSRRGLRKGRRRKARRRRPTSRRGAARPRQATSRRLRSRDR